MPVLSIKIQSEQDMVEVKFYCSRNQNRRTKSLIKYKIGVFKRTLPRLRRMRTKRHSGRLDIHWSFRNKQRSSDFIIYSYKVNDKSIINKLPFDFVWNVFLAFSI